MNEVTLMGNLGDNPELRYTSAGHSVANFKLATNYRWKDENGKSHERTEWHRIVAWGKTADNCAKYLKKGSKVVVKGHLQTRKWTDRNNVDRYTTEIVATRTEFLANIRSSDEVEQSSANNSDEALVNSEELEKEAEALGFSQQ